MTDPTQIQPLLVVEDNVEDNNQMKMDSLILLVHGFQRNQFSLLTFMFLKIL